jgi:hypothetical protein
MIYTINLSICLLASFGDFFFVCLMLLFSMIYTASLSICLSASFGIFFFMYMDALFQCSTVSRVICIVFIIS